MTLEVFEALFNKIAIDPMVIDRTDRVCVMLTNDEVFYPRTLGNAPQLCYCAGTDTLGSTSVLVRECIVIMER